VARIWGRGGEKVVEDDAWRMGSDVAPEIGWVGIAFEREEGAGAVNGGCDERDGGERVGGVGGGDYGGEEVAWEY
jgi:hypothetical protein